MQFVAIDVETANPDMASICQIGVARFVEGELTDEWLTFVDPEDYFDNANVDIHGIDQSVVKGQPTLPEIANHLRSMLENTVSVCHTSFDRVALDQAYNKYGLDPIPTTWLDSARVVRRTWKDLAWSGYGLVNVCNKVGYEFRHHDALEDAKAAGHVLLTALQESQLNLESWQRRVKQPIDPEKSTSRATIQRDGNPEGDLYGEIIVFTGALEIPRREAADLAADVGCQVASNVTKKTTILVVGDQDATRLAGHEKSTKHRKAEQLVAEGYEIRIIRESDFKLLVQCARS